MKYLLWKEGIMEKNVSSGKYDMYDIIKFLTLIFLIYYL